MNAKSLSGKGIVALLKETYTEWSNDKCMTLGASLAYYSIFSIAPLIMIAIGIVGAIYGQAAAEGEVTKQLTNVLGPQMAEAVGKLVQDAGKTSSATTITGIIVLLLGASGVFTQLKDALNTIWEVKPKPNQGIWGFVRSRLLTFGIVLVIGFLMLTSLILTTLVTAFNDYIEKFLGIPPFISQFLALVVPLAVEVLLFAMIFKLLPDAKVLWKNVWVGAAVTAVLFEIGKAFLSWYLARPSTASSFGAASSVVLMLVWVYYSSLILFFGAEFTEVWARSTGHVIKPDEHAVRETALERAQQGMEAGAPSDSSAATARSGAVNTG
ncbi:MAG: YihY/virulence factor BrkB family protein, partial [Verrucomicrobiaceae bacterium]